MGAGGIGYLLIGGAVVFFFDISDDLMFLVFLLSVFLGSGGGEGGCSITVASCVNVYWISLIIFFIFLGVKKSSPLLRSRRRGQLKFMSWIRVSCLGLWLIDARY